MEVKTSLLGELEKAKVLPYIKGDTLDQFKKFINAPGGLLIRENNIKHHVCSFFLPVHIPSQSIFLVHHIKAQDWIPPGGHIDMGESPVTTVYREYMEELNYQLKEEPVQLNNLTIKHIRSKRHPCKTHFDFWYTVLMPELYPFKYDANEFYEARWFPITSGLRKMKLPYYRKALADSISRYFPQRSGKV